MVDKEARGMGVPVKPIRPKVIELPEKEYDSFIKYANQCGTSVRTEKQQAAIERFKNHKSSQRR